MVKPTISAVAAMLSIAVIQSRTRRVITTSFTQCIPPVLGIIGGSKPRRRRMGTRVQRQRPRTCGPPRLKPTRDVMYHRALLAREESSHARQSAHCRATNYRGRRTVNMSRTERPTMPVRNIKSYLAVVAAAAAVGFGAAAPASTLASGSGGGAGAVSKQDF